MGASTAGRVSKGSYANIDLTLASSACGRVAGHDPAGMRLDDRRPGSALLVGVPGRRIERRAVGEKCRHRAHDLGWLVDPTEELVDIDPGRRLQRLPAAIDEDQTRADAPSASAAHAATIAPNPCPARTTRAPRPSSSPEPSATARTSSASVAPS